MPRNLIFLLILIFPSGSLLASEIDKTRLPIGDGHISQRPEAGNVWPCQTRGFGTRREHTGPWIKTDGTFDLLNKPSAAGDVQWPSQLRIYQEGAVRKIVGNLLPNHPTGIFPKNPSDPTYVYSPNPHPIKSRAVFMELQANPDLATNASCVPMGAIGILLSGSAIFNGLDANGQDAVAHEIQDKCQGHPERNGTYHYHNLTNCLKDEGVSTSHSALVGYAFDGFGIFGHRGEKGKVLSNADLDACHGHSHIIAWDGKQADMYHYHATWEYPYTVGCYKGKPQQLPRPSAGA